MADYVAVHKPGKNLTLTTSAAVTGGQLLAVGAAGTVAATSAATGAWIGVAVFDATTGTQVQVTSGGVQELTASAAITAGQHVIAASNGRVAPITGTDATQDVGLALTTAASGASVRVHLAR